MTITSLITFLGWCSVINLFLLLFATLFLIFAGKFAANFHSKLFAMEPEKLSVLYVTYLSNYKVLIIIFNLVPYWALKLML